MNVIFSMSSDFSTNQVIDWLLYQKKSFYRLNTDSIYQGKEQKETPNIQLTLNKGSVQFVIDGILMSGYWLRRIAFKRTRYGHNKIDQYSKKEVRGYWRSIFRVLNQHCKNNNLFNEYLLNKRLKIIDLLCNLF